MWDLGRQTAKLIERRMDLAVRRSALRRIQFHRGTGQTPVGTARNRRHYFQITMEFRHRRQERVHCMLPLRLQKQLRLIQKPLTNRSCRSSPGDI
jgi:hypothetical protein